MNYDSKICKVGFESSRFRVTLSKQTWSLGLRSGWKRSLGKTGVSGVREKVGGE